MRSAILARFAVCKKNDMEQKQPCDFDVYTMISLWQERKVSNEKYYCRSQLLEIVTSIALQSRAMYLVHCLCSKPCHEHGRCSLISIVSRFYRFCLSLSNEFPMLSSLAWPGWPLTDYLFFNSGHYSIEMYPASSPIMCAAARNIVI